MGGLQSQLEDIQAYLEKVANGELDISHPIIYQLQDVFNLLPDVKLDSFVRSVYVKTNDQMLVVYLASLIRSVVALHNLINNKIANSDAEKGETNPKKDSKDKDKDAKAKDKGDKEKASAGDSKDKKDSTSAKKK